LVDVALNGDSTLAVDAVDARPAAYWLNRGNGGKRDQRPAGAGDGEAL
jgi:hypothetical protein